MDRRPHRTIRMTIGVALVAASFSGTAVASDDLDWLVFGGTDTGASTFTTVGAKIASRGDGPALLLTAGGGTRRESFPTPAGDRIEARRTVATTAAVIGHQWWFDAGVIGAFVGPEGSLDILSAKGVRGRQATAAGLRLQQETWLRPSAETLVQTTVIASTSRRSLWTRVAGGIRLGEGYVGPEAGFYTDATGYRKYTLGLHATDFTLAGRHLRLSAGGQAQSDTGRIDPYVAFAFWQDW